MAATTNDTNLLSTKSAATTTSYDNRAINHTTTMYNMHTNTIDTTITNATTSTHANTDTTRVSGYD